MEMAAEGGRKGMHSVQFRPHLMHVQKALQTPPSLLFSPYDRGGEREGG